MDLKKEEEWKEEDEESSDEGIDGKRTVTKDEVKVTARESKPDKKVSIKEGTGQLHIT